MKFSCNHCFTAFSAADQYCGACGKLLASVVAEPARILLQEDCESVSFRLVNRGVKDAVLALRSSDTRAFPSWLVGGPVPDRAIVIPPGADYVASFRIVPGELPAAKRHVSGQSGHHLIPFITPALRRIGGTHNRRVIHLELAAQSRPRVRPEVIAYRFLPISEVTGGNIEAHLLRVTNEGGHELQLLSVSALDADIPGPTDVPRIPAAELLVVPQLARAVALAPGASFEQKFALQYRGKTSPGFFAATIRFVFRGNIEVNAHIEGILGTGPTLEHAGDIENIVRAAGGPTRVQIDLVNPGDIPVRILRAEVLGEDGEVINQRDWFHLRPIKERQLLAKKAKLELDVYIDPSVRSGADFEKPWGERVIRVHHDGQSEAGYLDCKISAELGKVRALKNAVIGIDFGTSSSSVSLLHGESGRAEALHLDHKAGKEHLASVLFYRGSRAEVSPFLFGQAAMNAASINYANLVRSIKSIVARDPDTIFNFVETGENGTRQLASYKSQALLEIFIAEVKRRAEGAMRRLPPALLTELGLLDTGVRFTHAVFTHPVGTGQDNLRALFAAAKSAGLSDDFERFCADFTLNEALAAVIAFVYVASGGAAIVPTDDERLLCIDVGGGTTDLAAVSVRGLRTFQSGQGTRVDLTLLASGGDARFGGDDLDRLLGHRLLDELSRHKDGALFDIAGVRAAMGYPSYESFRRNLLERYEGSTISAADLGERARLLFGKATDILREAERAKRVLTEEASVKVIPPVDDWPLRNPSAARPAGLRIEVELTRGEVQTLYQQPFAEAAALIDDVLRDAGWSGSDVSTVLFTGQGSRVPELRKALLARLDGLGLNARRTIVHPGALPGFDAKRCVAMGAAVWGDSKLGGGGWLSVTHRSTSQLSYSLQARRGPRYFDIEGLAAGADLPARAVHHFSVPSRALTLYRGRRLAFTFNFPEEVSNVELVAASDDHVVAHAGGHVIEGVRP